MNKNRTITYSLAASITTVLMLSSVVHGDLQQALKDGQAGNFKNAQKFLSEQTVRLEQQSKQTDILTAGRNCAAIGFNSMLIRIAEDCINKNLAPQYGQTLYDAAQKAGAGNLAKASSLAEQVTSAQPTYAPGYLILGRILMGRCLQEGTDCQKAIAVFRKALKLDPNLSVAHLDLAMLYHSRNDDKSAISEFDAACANNTDPVVVKWSHLMLTLLYAEKKQWPEAKLHATQAKSMGLSITDEIIKEIERHVPNELKSSRSVQNTALMTTKQLYDASLESGITGDFATARDYLTKAKTKEPSNMPVAIALILASHAVEGKMSTDAGICIFKSIKAGNAKNLDESLAQAKKASNMDPNCAPVFLHLGTVYVGLIQANKSNNYIQSAIAAYKKALAIDENLGIAYYNLGLALAATRQWAEARENILKARKLGVPVPENLLRQIESRIPKSKQ
jgi:tetratricopeptide (TPR) repeat protein